MSGAVLVAIVVALLGGGGIGGLLVAFSGITKDIIARRNGTVALQIAKEREEREAFTALISQAMSIATYADKQVKDVRAEAATDAAHMAAEVQAMREQIRLLTLRVSELEAEKAKDEYEKKQLKARIYDLEHGNGRARPRKTNTNTPL